MFEERPLPTVAPIHYFEISAALQYCGPSERLTNKHALPVTGELAIEEDFATVFMGWNEDELRIAVRGRRPFGPGKQQRLERSDALELFIDTRDIKTASFYTRFCHHFYLLLNPEADEQPAAEITRFRTEDRHPLCAPEDLRIERRSKSEVELRVPAKCLVGYDPELFPRLGFTYRLNREAGPAQHFGTAAEVYRFEQLPALWSSLRFSNADGSLR